MLAIDLSGRTALVTGACGGIGRAIVSVLHDAGARVALADVDEQALAEVTDGLPVRLDLTDGDSVTRGVAQVEEALGPVDLLVNNAGRAAATPGGPFTNQSADDWRAVLEVNLIGLFAVSRAVAPGMRARGRGAIVNIASVSGRAALQTDPAYSTSKAGVVTLTRIMAKDLAPHVRVNAIAPGMLMTPFYEAQYRIAAARDPAVAGSSPRAFFDEKARRLIPLQRGQEPEEIASAVAFLASDLAASVTGQTLNVDGGLLMS